VAAQSLARRVDARLDAPPFQSAVWGVMLADASGKTVYERNGHRLMMPASNTKLVVSAVAAALLPSDWTVATSVYGTGPIRDGVLEGDLVLYGRGDPTLAGVRCYAVDTTAAGACDREIEPKLRQLAAQIAAAGVRTVRGAIVGDGSWFGDDATHPSWERYDLAWWYAAPVTGLGVNDNAVDVRYLPGDAIGAPAVLSFTPAYADITLENRTRTVAADAPRTIDFFWTPGTRTLVATGDVPTGFRGATEYAAIPDPDRYAAAALRAMLAERGIAVLGPTAATSDSLRYVAARATVPLAEVRSRPLRDWIFPILNTSQNWYAEMLLKQLGRRFRGEGSWKAGLDVERRFLIDSVGIDASQFALSDGSGLAGSNLMSPGAFVRLLGYIRRHPGWATFAAGLPRSTATGSLRTRFVGTPLEGRVRAKTGSISRTNTLSGYVEQPDGRWLTFSVMANHHAQPSRLALQRIDSVVVELATRPR
jgi:D-alanyl-D-alanine carboxypeptidase/D-alanyl-D-alanine-endopeptidase (penicillin-binding protein 4)